MRYKAQITYKEKSVTINIQYKALEGKFTLIEFFNKVKEVKPHNEEWLHIAIDWPIDEIFKFEEGKMDIPQYYLEGYCEALKLPKKLKTLGVIEEKENKKILAATLKQIRISREIPQIILAGENNIPRSTYACYETGKITPDIITLWKLADYYKISIDELVGRKNK